MKWTGMLLLHHIIGVLVMALTSMYWPGDDSGDDSDICLLVMTLIFVY